MDRDIKYTIILGTVLLQLAGPYLFGFGNWCNVIQYLSGFGIPAAALHFYGRHQREIGQLKEQLTHLHQKHEQLMKEVSKR